MRILEPLEHRGLRLPSRIVVPAMVTRLSGEDGQVNRDIRDRYLRYAEGEVGLIVIEAMAVHGARSGPLLRISDDAFVPGLSELARSIHDASPSRVVPQIIHFLKVARSGWRQKVADLGAADLAAIIRDYGTAAERARRCGFDGVELHMAHAYTLSSFLSRRNYRPDRYGRTLENRLRLPTEVLAEVRRRVGADFPIGVRFDAEECIKDGYTVLDAREIALRLARGGADYLSLSAGGKFEDAIHKPGQPLYPYTGYSGDRCMPPKSYPEGTGIAAAAEIRAHLRAEGESALVVATGKIATPELAEAVLSEGKADLVGMARQLLADPDWVRKLRRGRPETIVRCVYGNVCKNLDENFRRVTCTLWPRGALQAPRSEDRGAPAWPEAGAALELGEGQGRLELRWQPALDGEGIYGYEIWRGVDGAPLAHLTSVRGPSRHWFDETATSGHRYRYQVRAYDLAGNRSPFSAEVAGAFAPVAPPAPSEPQAGSARNADRGEHAAR